MLVYKGKQLLSGVWTKINCPWVIQKGHSDDYNLQSRYAFVLPLNREKACCFLLVSAASRVGMVSRLTIFLTRNLWCFVFLKCRFESHSSASKMAVLESKADCYVKQIFSCTWCYRVYSGTTTMLASSDWSGSIVNSDCTLQWPSATLALCQWLAIVAKTWEGY